MKQFVASIPHENQEDRMSNVPGKLRVGATVECRVDKHAPFGVFVSIVKTGDVGILERIGLSKQGIENVEQHLPIGLSITCRVLGFRDWNGQFDLGLVGNEDGSRD